MINYFKYTSGNAFTLSGVDYKGFVNIDENTPFTGRVKNSFSKELSSKDNFLARSILEKREFDNSPSSFTTNVVNSLEYSPRNVLSNDFLKKNFTILYKNNLSLFSLGQVYNNSYLDTTNFKDEQTLGGFFGLSSTTIDDRDDDNKTFKNLSQPYQIDPFAGANKLRFPDLFEMDNARRAYVETYEDGFVYTVNTDSKTIAFSGNFSGEFEKIKNSSIQKDLEVITRCDVDKANGLIYSPSLNEDGLNYTTIYDRDIYRACQRLKVVDKIKTSTSKVINNNISFGKNYKVVQVIDDNNNINLEISPNFTSEILATIPISIFNNPEYVKVESRFSDDLLLIVTKPVSNTTLYNAYFLDIEKYLEDGIIPEPKTINRVTIDYKYKSPISKNSPITVFGTINNETGYYYPLFENEAAVKDYSLSIPEGIIFPEFPDKIFYYVVDDFRFNLPENRPNGFFIYRNDDSIIDLDLVFSDYDSNLFTLKDNGNVTERMVSNPEPVTSFLDADDLLFPPPILFTSDYKFTNNNWKFNTNLLESNRVSLLDINTDVFKEKTYTYFHNKGRLYFTTGTLNKKRISLVPADLQSFFNPSLFDTICETSLGINLNVLIQDILRDTINIYNNFTRIPQAGTINNVEIFSDYKIPDPLDIDTRNFYFHSNESVNYLSINRVFSKLFELQKTIYDSILSS